MLASHLRKFFSIEIFIKFLVCTLVLSYWITTVSPVVLCALGVVLLFNMEFLLLIVSLESSFSGNHRAQELEGVLKTYREEK